LTIEYFLDFAFTPELTGSLNMGIDEVLGREYLSTRPFLRLYTWSDPTISVGHNQNPERRVNLDLCGRHGIDVVKRPTGGKELLHGQDLCYSVFWPSFDGATAVDAKRLFDRINEALVRSLANLGIEAEWNQIPAVRGAFPGPCLAQTDRGEITVAGKKLIASAQRIFPGTVLQQGSMSLRPAVIDICEYLTRFDKEETRKQIADNSTCLYALCPETISLGSVVEGFRKGFAESFGISTNPTELDFDSIGKRIGNNKINNRIKLFSTESGR